MRRSTRLTAAAVAASALAVIALLQAPLSSAEDLRAEVAAAEAELMAREMAAQAALEDYSGATIALDAANEKLTKSQQRVDEARAAVEATREGIGKFAASAYRAGGLDFSLQVFLADDPQQFLDQATVLDILADNQAASLRRTESARLRLAQAEAELAQRQQEAQARSDEAAAFKAEADRLYAEADAYLAGLREELRLQIIEEQRRAAEEAARRAAAAQAAADAAAAAAQEAQEAQEQQQQDQGQSSGSGSGSGSGSSGNDWSGQTAGSDRAAIAVSAALAQLGEPYDPTGGGRPPDTWDCSKLTAWAWGQAGVRLTPYSFTQATEVQRIDANELQPGDLLFFFEGGAHHVSMYIGGGQIIEASSPRTGVRITDVWNSWNSTYFTMAGRPYA